MIALAFAAATDTACFRSFLNVLCNEGRIALEIVLMNFSACCPSVPLVYIAKGMKYIPVSHTVSMRPAGEV